MTARPLVAVAAYHLDETRVARWPAGGFGVPTPYVAALRAAGVRSAIIGPGEPGTPQEILEPFAGLVLVGGGDLAPAWYRQDPGPHLYGVEPDRDDAEIALVLAADEIGIPVLAICRGIQVLNVAFGGSLLQHLPDVPGLMEHGVPIEETESVHDVAVSPSSRLEEATGARVLSCTSHHHQGLDTVGAGLVVTGRTADGLAEAIERTSGWIVGVQWHPEETAARDPSQEGLFRAFAERTGREPHRLPPNAPTTP